MNEAEFDKFAEEYRASHAANIRITGEGPEYFAEYKIAHLSSVAPSLGLSDDSNVLDFGAGIGNSVPYFRKYWPNCRLSCLDVSRKSLEIGRTRYTGQADFVHFDGRHLPFPEGHFDVVFAACVFHHIPKAEHVALLREMNRVLRPRGALMIFEHNPYNPLTLHAVNTCPFDENAQLLRANDLRASIQESDFTIMSTRYCVFFPRTLRALRRLEPRLGWLPLGGQYCVSAFK